MHWTSKEVIASWATSKEVIASWATSNEVNASWVILLDDTWENPDVGQEKCSSQRALRSALLADQIDFRKSFTTLYIVGSRALVCRFSCRPNPLPPFSKKYPAISTSIFHVTTS
jgi:hypothetical protein